MGKIGIGLNLEAVRTSHKSFEWAVQFAKELGYEYIEPMVHWGRELLSEARYFHSVSMLDDPFRIRDAVEAAGLTANSSSSAGLPCCFTVNVSVPIVTVPVRAL